ncbi:8002_t:CDS:2 [Dentiscutata erythropus]|uniref:8002_t:CDS:1 n=1 Tax=Dentiscutata erythropus TaxID=1348616 RepID=A0A9N8WL46_9GLOM|nr:8002_t:CDS:2 [Dentiscutata erythropus]
MPEAKLDTNDKHRKKSDSSESQHQRRKKPTFGERETPYLTIPTMKKKTPNRTMPTTQGTN